MGSDLSRTPLASAERRSQPLNPVDACSTVAGASRATKTAIAVAEKAHVCVGRFHPQQRDYPRCRSRDRP